MKKQKYIIWTRSKSDALADEKNMIFCGIEDKVIKLPLIKKKLLPSFKNFLQEINLILKDLNSNEHIKVLVIVSSIFLAKKLSFYARSFNKEIKNNILIYCFGNQINQFLSNNNFLTYNPNNHEFLNKDKIQSAKKLLNYLTNLLNLQTSKDYFLIDNHKIAKTLFYPQSQLAIKKNQNFFVSSYIKMRVVYLTDFTSGNDLNDKDISLINSKDHEIISCFASASAVKAYINLKLNIPDYAIAIGNSTYHELIENKFKNIHISNETHVESMINICKKLL